MPDRIAYKVMTESELDELHRAGEFRGSRLDVTDGFIHLSSGAQLAETVNKHFRGIDGLVIVAVDLARLGDIVRWEPSRDEQFFPHIYGLLPMEAVVAAVKLERMADGSIKMPA